MRFATPLACSALVIATVAVYSPVVHYGFLRFDDPVYITQNPHIRDGLTRRGAAWAFTEEHASNWHPLTWLSHMLDVELFGMRPGPHHATNVLLHAASSVILLLFLHRITGAFWRSSFVSFLFALHPLRVESVAWISERKDVLSVFFGLLALAAYVSYRRNRGALRYALSLVLFAASLLSKPMLVTLPFVLLLLDYWPLGRWSSKATARQRLQDLVREKLPFFGLAAISCWIAFAAQRHGGALASFEGVPIGARLSNALVSYLTYARKMLWPSDLAIFYPYRADLSYGAAAAAAVVLALITWAVLRFGRRFPYLPVGWLWYAGTLVPVIGIVQVGAQAMADRYTYFPTIGLSIAAAWLFADVLGGSLAGKRILAFAGATTLATAALATGSQLEHWKDDERLFEHAVRVTGKNPLAYAILGEVSAERGDLDGAVRLYRSVLDIEPNSILAHNNLGIALAQQGKHDEAVHEFQKVLELDPSHAKAHRNLGNLYEARHRADLAIEHYRESVRLDPHDPDAHLRLAARHAGEGRAFEAVASYRRTLELEPDRLEALNNLAWLLATNANRDVRNGPEAVRLAEHASRRTLDGHPEVLDTLAAAYAEAGRFDDAARTARRGLALASARGQRGVELRLQGHLALFLSRQPVRETDATR